MIEKLKFDKNSKKYIDDEGNEYDNKIEYLHIAFFEFCVCGDVFKNIYYIYNMLKKVEKKDLNNLNDCSYIFFIYWADKENLIEHGTSIDFSWLTEKAKKFIRDVEILIEDGGR